jgi:hypothetical protein
LLNASSLNNNRKKKKMPLSIYSQNK